jgi:hypothetical protein
MFKKQIFFISLFVFSFLVNTNAQFRIGPTGGLNFNRQVFKSNTYKYEALFKNQLGFHVGAISDVVITPYLSLQSELIYTRRGGYYSTERTNVSEEYKAVVGYISLPLCMTLKKDVKGAYVIAGAGPYIERLMHSSHSYSSNGADVENGSLRVGTNFLTDQIKPWSAGVKLKSGFELKSGFYTVVYYDIGTADINPQLTVTRNKTYGVQFGYIFSLTEEDRYNRFNNFYEF